MTTKDNSSKIIHRKNKLKSKAGLDENAQAAGEIDINTIRNVQKIIDRKEAEYPIEIKKTLKALQHNWAELKNSQTNQQQKYFDKIFHGANNIKDLTAMYEHNLMHHFSLSLRNICEKISPRNKEHKIIMQAHIDVMWITYQEQLRSDQGAKAEELKTLVSAAIFKHL